MSVVTLTPLTEEQQALVVDHEPFARWWVAEQTPDWLVQRLGYDEALSAAREGLVVAAARFDPHRGVQYKTWAGHWMRRAIQDAYGRRREVVLASDLANDEELSPYDAALAAVDSDPSESASLREQAAAILTDCRGREREVCQALLAGATELREIGERLGVSHQRAWQYLDRIRERHQRRERERGPDRA